MRNPPAGPEPDSDAVAQVAIALGREVDDIAEAAAEAIFDAVPAYRDARSTDFRAEVVHHCASVFRALVRCLRDDRPPRAADFPFTSLVAMSRVQHGIALPDFLRGFRIGQRTFWSRLVQAREGEQDAAEVIARAAELLMEVIELGSSAAAAAYLEVEQFHLADQDRVRRDVVEDLLEGRPPTIRPRQQALTAARLEPDAPLVVSVTQVSAAGGGTDPESEKDVDLGRVRGVLREAADRNLGGILVARRSEVIGIFPTTRDADVVAFLREAAQALRPHEIEVGSGVSTPHRGWLEVAEAYREGLLAARGAASHGGVLGLSEMSTLDFLTLTDDRTLRRLIDRDVATFLAEEAAGSGIYLETLDAYVAHDLNARQAAEHLHTHVNTVYYRLERVAERTGLNLRSFRDVVQLVSALRVLRGTTALHS